MKLFSRDIICLLIDLIFFQVNFFSLLANKILEANSEEDSLSFNIDSFDKLNPLKLESYFFI